MSIRVMAMVWDTFPIGGSAMLGMLALADWCNDEGTSLHPSIRAFSQKCRLSEVQGRRVLHDLINKGFVEVVGHLSGGAPGTTRQYRIRLDRLRAIAHESPTPITDESPTPLADDSPRENQTALIDDRDGSHGREETALMGESQTTIEPSRTTSRAKKRALVSLETFILECKAKGEQVIPDQDPIYSWNKKIPSEMILLCWRVFKEKHLGTSKRKADWRAHFRNAVKLAWYRLWYFDGATGECCLSTAGRQYDDAYAQETA